MLALRFSKSGLPSFNALAEHVVGQCVLSTGSMLSIALPREQQSSEDDPSTRKPAWRPVRNIQQRPQTEQATRTTRPSPRPPQPVAGPRQPPQQGNSRWGVHRPISEPEAQQSQNHGRKSWHRQPSSPYGPHSPSFDTRRPPSNRPQFIKPAPKRKTPARQVVQELKEIVVSDVMTVAKLATNLNLPIPKLEEMMKELGEPPKSDEEIVPVDIAELVALELGFIVKIAKKSAHSAAEADAVPRPAVVTVMGHVDHGKTTLLDALRSTSVAAGEAGGITQHIGAFEVKMPDSKTSLTFLDTPGHAAFSAMRARGAAATDIVVLVVAADDGVMPQTREALAHARASGCPIIVAITKCDVPAANPEKVRRQLLGDGLELEEVGGSIQVVEVSAVAKKGLLELEEALLLQAEMMELKASHTKPAEGVVIEAKVDRGQGPVATIIVTAGTLKVGDIVIAGSEWGKVRSLKAATGAVIKSVFPGQPAEISGLKGVPMAGDEVMVVASEDRAQRVAKARGERDTVRRHRSLAQQLNPKEEEVKVVPVIIKADVQGSAEAAQEAIKALGSAAEQVDLRVIHVGVGPVSPSDVGLASPLGAVILGFGVKPASGVEALAKRENVTLRCHNVIYHLLEEVDDMLAGAAPLEEIEIVSGIADVLQVFELRGKRGGVGSRVAGCRVTEGSIKGDGAVFRVLRQNEVIHKGPCASLRRHKLDVGAVGKGSECGLSLQGYDGVQVGDVLEYITIGLKRREASRRTNVDK